MIQKRIEILKALSPFAPRPITSKTSECSSEDLSLEKDVVSSNLLCDKNSLREIEPPPGEVDTLKIKSHQCQHPGDPDNFQKDIENDSEILISKLEAEKSELKNHLRELELMNENLSMINENQSKQIECLLSEKAALEISVDKLKSLDEYINLLEKERSVLGEIEHERDQLRMQIMNEKEKSKDFAGLQQLVKKLTKERDTLNLQLSKQRDAATNAVNHISSELKEEKEVSNRLYVLANQLYRVISHLKKNLLALSENKDFYKKKLEVRLCNLNRRILETESTENRLSDCSKMFDCILEQIQIILYVVEYFKQASLSSSKFISLLKKFEAALIHLSGEIESIRKILPKNINDNKQLHLRSSSESNILIKTASGKNNEPFKSTIIRLCADNKMFVQKLFSMEKPVVRKDKEIFSMENLDVGKDMEIVKSNFTNDSKLVELGTENFKMKIDEVKCFSSNSTIVLNLDQLENCIIPYLLQRISCKNIASALPIFLTKQRTNAFTSLRTSEMAGKLLLKREIQLNDSLLKMRKKPLGKVLCLEKIANQFSRSHGNSDNLLEVAQSSPTQKPFERNTDSASCRNFDSERLLEVQGGADSTFCRNANSESECEVLEGADNVFCRNVNCEKEIEVQNRADNASCRNSDSEKEIEAQNRADNASCRNSDSGKEIEVQNRADNASCRNSDSERELEVQDGADNIFCKNFDSEGEIEVQSGADNTSCRNFDSEREFLQGRADNVSCRNLDSERESDIQDEADDAFYQNFDSERECEVQNGIHSASCRNVDFDYTSVKAVSDFEHSAKEHVVTGENYEVVHFKSPKNVTQEVGKYSLIARTSASKSQEICMISEACPLFIPDQNRFSSKLQVNPEFLDMLNFFFSPFMVHDQRQNTFIQPSDLAVFDVNEIETKALQLPSYRAETDLESAKNFENFKKEDFSGSFETGLKILNAEVTERKSMAVPLKLENESAPSINHLSGFKLSQLVENSDGLKSVENVSRSVIKEEQLICDLKENFNVGDSTQLKKRNIQQSKPSRKYEKKRNWFTEINSLRLKNYKLRRYLSNFKAEAISVQNLKLVSDFEGSVKKLNEFLAQKNETNNIIDEIRNEYEKRIVVLTEGYEERLMEVKERHNKDFKSLSQIYVEKLKHANEIHAQNIESTEDLNLRVLKNFQNFYDSEVKEWENVMAQYSQKFFELQRIVEESDENMNAQLLSAVNKYESLLHLVCEAFDHEKVAIYAFLSESLKNFEDDYKGSLRKIATKLDNDSVILQKLVGKELERCKRKYEQNLKQQKNSYKILLEEAKKSYEKKLSQKTQLGFSNVLLCNCDSAVSQL